MLLLGLSAALLAVIVLLAWVAIEIRQHAARFREHAGGADAHRRSVQELLEPEAASLIEPTFPMETCGTCRGPIGKRRESDRMWRCVKGSRVQHHHENCWRPTRPDDLQEK